MSPEDLLETALNGDPLDALAAIRELRNLINEIEHTHVIALRRHGASWTFIGHQLGITRQSTHQRYSDYDPQQR